MTLQLFDSNFLIPMRWLATGHEEEEKNKGMQKGGCGGRGGGEKEKLTPLLTSNNYSTALKSCSLQWGIISSTKSVHYSSSCLKVYKLSSMDDVCQHNPCCSVYKVNETYKNLKPMRINFEIIPRGPAILASRSSFGFTCLKKKRIRCSNRF